MSASQAERGSDFSRAGHSHRHPLQLEEGLAAARSEVVPAEASTLLAEGVVRNHKSVVEQRTSWTHPSTPSYICNYSL